MSKTTRRARTKPRRQPKAAWAKQNRRIRRNANTHATRLYRMVVELDNALSCGNKIRAAKFERLITKTTNKLEAAVIPSF